MRLLQAAADGKFTVQFYRDDQVPPYAILSHTWAEHNPEAIEVLYKDILDGTAHEKEGYQKLLFCNDRAHADGLEYFWVDTCAFNRESSAETQTAITSMFGWYEKAKKCYVLLSDVQAPNLEDQAQADGLYETLRSSRWFSRGWTLQELLAPRIVEFFSSDGVFLGDKTILANEINRITGIPILALKGVKGLASFSEEERFAWARDRQTTVKEDQSYCLLGIFGVSMSTRYGEGAELARQRLKNKIRKKCETLESENLKALEWLSSANFAEQQQDLIARRAIDTGTWFEESAEFNEWQRSTGKTLFCPGDPGVGKTMISAIAIQVLSTIAEVEDEVGLSYIFCSYQDQTTHDAREILSAIFKQLLQRKYDGMQILHPIRDKHSAFSTMPTIHELIDGLVDISAMFSQVFLIVDALDECDNTHNERDLLLRSLGDIQGRTGLNIMFTSRFDVDLENHIGWRLEVRATNADIKRYIASSIIDMPRCIQRSEALQIEIATRVSATVMGMFLLATFYVGALRHKITVTQVRNALESFGGSSAIDKAYDSALERIDRQVEEHRQLARRVLSWMTYAKRLLSVEELCHALAMDISDIDQACENDEWSFYPENIPDVQDIIPLCAGLVTVDEGSNIIRLVHYTAQEYLLRVRDRWIPMAELELAHTCLAYLSLPAFRSGSCGTEYELEQRAERYPLLVYAAAYWHQHCHNHQHQIAPWLDSRFFHQSSLAACREQAAKIKSHGIRYVMGRKQPKNLSFLCTIEHGLDHLTKELLMSNNFSADITNSLGQTPLWLAVKHRRELIIRDLLDRPDIQINTIWGSGESALLYALKDGQETVVRWLLDRPDVHVNIVDAQGNSALTRASQTGNQALVELLLARVDVAVNLANNVRQTPLSCAAANGFDAIVGLLLGRDDIDVNFKDQTDQSALSRAASNGHEKVVRLLLAHTDIDVDSMDCEGRTPFSRAAEQRHENICQLLLIQHDVDVNSLSMSKRTPLSFAAQAGAEDLGQLLLRRNDVSADFEDTVGRTPLSYTPERDADVICQLLLGRADVEVNSVDLRGRTPLSYAAQYHAEATIKLLLARDDVDASSKDVRGRSPLSYAAQANFAVACKLLLAQDEADCDSKDINGRTPLSHAAQHNARKTSALLLARSADSDSKDIIGRTPLSYAAQHNAGKTSVLLLARSDVDVNSRDIYGCTPLLYAAKYNAEAVCRLLVAHDDVNVNCKSSAGLTPLFWAALNGSEAIFKLLLGHDDVDTECCDPWGRSPLSLFAEHGNQSMVRLLLRRRRPRNHLGDNPTPPR